ncbi:hypothetical protein HOL21_04250 [Candidatus Woesearchaeota archaeon]|jgi:hypothetical protein|nr:hypothetical protein [Candidatus Woesearchaeota archaeon]MBT5397398.1 hypothetical protein [Candidatus Woesearchaeota archaeon]MBT5924334.1 hypothetical protein [Candidatus Woesearchaeota archaeon]MBT6367756.1 hypothetical protein [Candidatus Woesearchaeota archaeon]MBT7762798.1 hypothetical protein [Candidatus Woesearchaeota archaeon]
MEETKKHGLLTTMRDWYSTHKTARAVSKAIAGVTFVDPASAALDALVGTQTVATAQAKPASGCVELMAGHESATLDTKLFVPVAPDTTLFTRSRITPDYETGKVGSFHIASLAYDVFKGIEVFGELDAIPGVELDPRAGVQYFTKLGDVSLFGLASVGLKETPDGSALLNVRYSPAVSDTVRLVFGAEIPAGFDKSGITFAEPRLRAGVDIDGYHIGFAADLNVTGSGDLTPRYGGFVMKPF